jgi:hypothetical protein
MSTLGQLPPFVLTPPRPGRGLLESEEDFARRMQTWEGLRADAIARTRAARREWERQQAELPADINPPPGWPPVVGRSAEAEDFEPRAAGSGEPPRDDPPSTTSAGGAQA